MTLSKNCLKQYHTQSFLARKGGRNLNQDCNKSPDELDCLVLVVVVPAVAELDQLLVSELKVPHDAVVNSFHLIRQLSLLSSFYRVQCP